MHTDSATGPRGVNPHVCRGECTSRYTMVSRTAYTAPWRTWYTTGGSSGIRGDLPRTTDTPSCTNPTSTKPCNSEAGNCRGRAKRAKWDCFGVWGESGWSVHDRDWPRPQNCWTGRMAALVVRNAGLESQVGAWSSFHTSCGRCELAWFCVPVHEVSHRGTQGHRPWRTPSLEASKSPIHPRNRPPWAPSRSFV